MPAPADLDTFQISLDILEAHLTSHTQAVLVNSPNNPTGVVYSRQTLEGLAELLRRKSTQFGHPIYLIADEPYRELVYDGVEVPFLPTIYPNTLVCYSYSKSLSLPGERIGYVCVPSCVEGQADVLHAVAGAAPRPRRGPGAAGRMSRGCGGVASDELCLLVVLNTASIQLLPTTLAGVRASLGTADPFDILPAVWLTSLLSVLAGLLAAKLFAHFWRN